MQARHANGWGAGASTGHVTRSRARRTDGRERKVCRRQGFDSNSIRFLVRPFFCFLCIFFLYFFLFFFPYFFPYFFPSPFHLSASYRPYTVTSASLTTNGCRRLVRDDGVARASSTYDRPSCLGRKVDPQDSNPAPRHAGLPAAAEIGRAHV